MPVDSNGLLLSDRFSLGGLFDQEKVLSTRRCCIVGEGGIGKTEFVRKNCGNDGMFKVFYAADVGDSDIIPRIKAVCASHARKISTIVIDGVDGSNPSFLSRFVDVMSWYKKMGFIVTATDCRVGEYLSEMLSGTICLTMAPLSRNDIHSIANNILGADNAEIFYNAVEQSNLLSICRTPIGVNVLCEYWRESKRLSPSRVELLRRFVADLCESNANGKISLHEKYSAARYRRCARVVAGAMLISGCNRIAVGSDVKNGEGTLVLSDVFSGEDMEVAAQLLRRAVFSPVQKGGYTFSHRLYFSLLASEWACEIADPSKVQPLFIDDNKRIAFPQNAEIAGIVALRNKGLFDKLLSIAPECLALYASEMPDAQKDRLFPAFVHAVGRDRRMFVREPIRLESFSSKNNSAWVARRVRHYSSLSDKELRVLLSAYRKFNLATESRTMIAIVLDGNLSIRIRIAAMPLIKSVDDSDSRNKLQNLLEPRMANEDIDELSFKSCLVSTLYRLGFQIERLLPGIVSIANIDSRNVYSRYLRELRAKFVSMLNSSRCGKHEVALIAGFASECLCAPGNNYHVRVMAIWAFQFAWMKARSCDAVPVLAEVYANLLLCEINPLKFYNRESSDDLYLTDNKLRADFETRRDVVATIVRDIKYDERVIALMVLNNSLLLPEDEVWVARRLDECEDLQIKCRWNVLLNAARKSTSRVERRVAISQKKDTGERLLLSVPPARANRFVDVVSEMIKGKCNELNFAIDIVIQDLTGRESSALSRICGMAAKYLRRALVGWKGSEDSALNIFCAIAVLQRFDGGDIVGGFSGKQLERIFDYMLENGAMLHQKYLSPIVEEFEKRFGVQTIDLLYRKWPQLKRQGRTSLVETMAKWIKRTTVEAFWQKSRAGKYAPDFSEAMTQALLGRELHPRCENMRIFASYIHSKCFDTRGRVKTGNGSLYFWYCYLQNNPQDAMERLSQIVRVKPDFAAAFFKIAESRLVFENLTLSRMTTIELEAAFDFISKQIQNCAVDRHNILSRMIALNEDEAFDAIERLSMQHPECMDWERWLSIVEMQRKVRAFKRAPRECVAEELRKYYSDTKEEDSMNTSRKWMKRLLWVALTTGVGTIVTIAINRILNENRDSSSNVHIDSKNDQSVHVDQSMQIDDSQKLDFKGAVFNGPVSIRTEKNVGASPSD